MVMEQSISILLAAGFSAPMGYPIGNTLNNKLLELRKDTCSFSPDGRLISKDGTEPNLGYKNNYDIDYEYCVKLIQYYNSQKGKFDYEEFYDYLIDEASKDNGAKEIASKHFPRRDFILLLSGQKNIYNQLVSSFIEDSNGKKWYDDEPYFADDSYEGYTGFMRYLKSIGKNKIVNIHTLNHDLFFEYFNNTALLDGKLCDGFEELESPYYGDLHQKGRIYKSRLQYYTGKYDKVYRLYKLHGSLDYGIYYITDDHAAMKPESYIKTRYGIGFSNLYKEKRNKNGELEYERCWINYHSDFLTGTTSKIERYGEPLLYKELFQRFKNNLEDSEKLIIVGYGAKDTEINNIIAEHFDFKNKPAYIIDPYAKESVHSFAKHINATIIKKHLENINASDLEP